MKQIYKINVDPEPVRVRAKYDLDGKISPRRYKSRIIRSIREAKRQHRLNGATYTYSTFLRNFDDNTMTLKRAADILGEKNFSDRRKYTIDVIYTSLERKMSKKERRQLDEQIKYYQQLNQPREVDRLLENTAKTWKIFHHRRRVTYNDTLFTLTSSTKPGALVGIDQQYYNLAYPFNVITYGIFPVAVPHEREVAGMKLSSTLNCVAEQVIKHFEGSRRGAGLTEARRAKITTWNESIERKGTGATKHDVAELEKKLKVPIIVKMLPDRIFYSSGCYRKAGTPIKIIDHNFHAWGINEGDFPDNKTVRYYHDGMFDWIANNVNPVNVWLFSSSGDQYDQFVTSTGEIYRTEALQRSMEEFAGKYVDGKRSPEDAKSHIDRLTQTSFTVSSIAAQFAREKNSWKPTKKKFIEDVRASCIEYGHGGLWNTKYDLDEMVSVDMIACYPGSFLGGGECSEYFKRFGLPTHRMARRVVNGPLPDYDLTGFALVTSFKLADGLHPVCYLLIGRHLHEKRWAPTPLLRWMLDSGVLTSLTISEVIFSCDKQTEVWLPTPDKFPRYDIEFLRDAVTSECKRIGRIIIGKFTQGESATDDGNRRRKTAKLVLDPGELKFIIDDAVSKGVFYRQTAAQLSSAEPFGTIVEYFNDEMPQYVHLRSFMLAYVSINLLSMVNRFPTIAVRVAVDSFNYDKRYHNDVQKYLGDGATWGTWRVMHEELHRYREHADVVDQPEYHSGVIEKISTSPSIHDPVARHRIIYLNGPGGCGKTTRVIELFHGTNLIALTPTHRLARDFKEKNVAAVTYHSFFRWSGDAWTPDRMGTKVVPDVVLWDEPCTVPKKIIKMFLEWLNTKNTTVVLCGDHGQPPPFTGMSPHCWLKRHVNNYEEMTIDLRSLDDELTTLKAAIRCTNNQNQAAQLRAVIPATSLDEFYNTWTPSDIVVASRKSTRDILVRKLFYLHEEKFSHEPVPLCYRPKDTRRQNVLVDIPGRAEQQELVLSDIVDVDLSVVRDAINAVNSPWRLGYATTIHSSQGLTITDTTMWIVDDFIEWDNLVYMAVSRVRRISQFR